MAREDVVEFPDVEYFESRFCQVFLLLFDDFDLGGFFNLGVFFSSTGALQPTRQRQPIKTQVELKGCVFMTASLNQT